LIFRRCINLVVQIDMSDYRLYAINFKVHNRVSYRIYQLIIIQKTGAQVQRPVTKRRERVKKYDRYMRIFLSLLKKDSAYEIPLIRAPSMFFTNIMHKIR
jgi:hypothetical protein